MVSGQWWCLSSNVWRPAARLLTVSNASEPVCSVLSHYKSHDRQTQLPPVMSCYVMLCNVNSRACTFLQSELMKSPVCRLTGAFVLVVQLHYAHWICQHFYVVCIDCMRSKQQQSTTTTTTITTTNTTTTTTITTRKLSNITHC